MKYKDMNKEQRQQWIAETKKKLQKMNESLKETDIFKKVKGL